MRGRADAGHAVLHLLLIGLHVGLELLEGLGRQVLLGDQHHRVGAAEANRLEILLAVVGQRLVERDVDRERAHMGEAQRVSIGSGARDLGDADRAAGAADILNDHLLAQRLAHALAEDARQGVGGAAGRERHDHGDRLVRIGLSHRRKGHYRKAARRRRGKQGASFHRGPP
jgi:hypothetical protein